MKILNKLLILSFLLISSCSDSNSDISNDIPDNNNNNNNNSNNNNNDGSWLIDKNIVFDGGPGKDGIPALLNPGLIRAEEANFLSDDDLVVVFKYEDAILAFPHKILDWHEIINVDISDLSLGIIYCPLTGTAVGWNRVMNNNKTTFGVSGLLYKNNIIPYDRATDSNWSQLRLECVNGELKGNKPDITVLNEMNWGTWKKIYDQTWVVGTNTGFSRNYDVYPYGSYKTNHEYFIFPIDALNNNVPSKERVHVVIIDQSAKVYRFDSFGNGRLIKDSFAGKQLLIVGNQDFIVSFELNADSTNLDFSYDYNGTEIILSDDEGNKWNLFGEALSGPRKGNFLNAAKTSMMAYYFSIESFYPNVVIY